MLQEESTQTEEENPSPAEPQKPIGLPKEQKDHPIYIDHIADRLIEGSSPEILKEDIDKLKKVVSEKIDTSVISRVRSTEDLEGRHKTILQILHKKKLS